MSHWELAAVRAFNALSDRLDHAYRAFEVFRSELMVAAVPPDQWQKFTNFNYDRNRLFRSQQHHQRLYGWERRAIAEHFPPAPAKVLVGGAGAGREVAGLVDLGYRVAAFDPAPQLVALGQQRCRGVGVLGWSVGGYEDLVSGTLGVDQHAPFGAVVLGWGSLSHAAQSSTRVALTQRLRQLAPNGPVLLSWIASRPEGAQRERLRQLLHGLGLRHRTDRATFRPHMGFIHLLDDHDLESMARAGGYRVAARDVDEPRAVLVPAS